MAHLDLKEVNAENADGVTAFYRAAANNHVDILRLLKEHGARGDIAAEGTVPVHAAVSTTVCLAPSSGALPASWHQTQQVT